jgi:hypothetical protein
MAAHRSVEWAQAVRLRPDAGLWDLGDAAYVDFNRLLVTPAAKSDLTSPQCLSP